VGHLFKGFSVIYPDAIPGGLDFLIFLNRTTLTSEEPERPGRGIDRNSKRERSAEHAQPVSSSTGRNRSVLFDYNIYEPTITYMSFEL
jgi:hypothetical protein